MADIIRDDGRGRVMALGVASALAVALVVVVAPPAAAATITPTVFNDEINADGDCSLREAIQAANTDAVVDACTQGSGADTISLAAGTYQLSLAGASENANQNGDLDITTTITIDGVGAESTIIDANDIDRVLDSTGSGNLTLQQLTVTDGSTAFRGGGISTTGPLTLTEVAVTNNSAADGGGIVVIGLNSSATITRSTISGNTATAGSDGGGGITFGNGNALASSITNSTISDNDATGDGGGIRLDGPNSQDVTLLNVTVAGNTAAGDGGGLSSTALADGIAFRPKNTIVADNSADGSGDDCFGDADDGIVSDGNTLIENTSGCTITAGTGDLTGSDPGLAALADNGGETQTHALSTSSIAVDAGTNTGCPATDQRGLTRPLDGPDANTTATCDIGAYELGFADPNVFTDDITANGNCTLREAIQAANTDAFVDGCDAGSGADTISLSAGTYVLSIAGANENANQTGDLDITATVTIDGTGAESTIIDANDIDRVIHRNVNADISLQQLTVTDGSATEGGGIALTSSTLGSLTLTDVAVTNNVATSSLGGGIRSSAVATITSSTISGNTAASAGGGVYALVLTMTNATISGNSAATAGGGVFFDPTGDFVAVNSTIAGNTAGSEGGGVHLINAGPGEELRSTNTLIADNSAPSGPDCLSNLGQNEFISEGNTLVENTSGCDITAGTGDITGQDPALGALADNGGETQTHALGLSSVAVDSGTNTGCPATDQRGTTRPQDGPDVDTTATCDIGAYELFVRALTATKSGLGSGTIASNIAGINCGSDCSELYLDAPTVTLTATPVAGSTFTGWSGDCTGTGTCVVSMSVTRSVTASFEGADEAPTLRSLTVSRTGPGSGTVTSTGGGIDCGSDCTQSYAEGTSVTLTAAPDTGSDFAGWGGACSGTDETCMVTMDAAKSVEAMFDLESSTLSVTKTGRGRGNVTSDPAGIDCGSACAHEFDVGMVVTLQAQAEPNSSFARWGGACSGAEAVCSLEMADDLTANARFVKTLTISYVANRDRFKGRVFSTDPNCRSDRAVVLKMKRPGADKKIGRDRTNRRGRWAIEKSAARGRFYAVVRGKPGCHRATSDPLRLP